MAYATQRKQGEERNRLYQEDLPVHEWYRFVLSFPPHLVRDYVKKFDISEKQCILDPFCGTGTTLVESRKLGIASIGIEANPVAHFAASAKTDWDINAAGFKEYTESVAGEVQSVFDHQGITRDDGPLFRIDNPEPMELKSLDAEQMRLLIKNSISPLPLHKVLSLLEVLDARNDQRFNRHAKLALAKQLVYSISNLRFGPEIGVGKIKSDAPVLHPWLQAIENMIADIELTRYFPTATATVHLGDAREAGNFIKPASIDAVITSPPYPNEKDYSRTTRLESVLLGFTTSREELRQHKKKFVRSNTRGVYKNDGDDKWVNGLPYVRELADSIEQKRIKLQKTSGFEKLYARVVRLYFGGMARHLEGLKPLLRPGAKLAYVVGDQASYFRTMIRTGQILAAIAESSGYEVLGIDLFRTRFSTATRENLREEVVLLQWNGTG